VSLEAERDAAGELELVRVVGVAFHVAAPPRVAPPAGLVDGEFSGREKVAFIGAMSRQVGRFEIAGGSAVFLDEVGELPLEVQVKLLHVLQEGEFERLGSPRTIKVDLRVIAATNRDLAAEVRAGRFFEDRYYRLNVFPIRMPALRERVEDIALLVGTFLDECCTRMGEKITQVPRRTMDDLQRYLWPGNVRELRIVIEHGAIISAGNTLSSSRLGDDGPGASLRQMLADAGREHLRTLRGTGWRVKEPRGAAIVPGVNPATHYSCLRTPGIQLRGAGADRQSCSGLRGGIAALMTVARRVLQPSRGTTRPTACRHPPSRCSSAGRTGRRWNGTSAQRCTVLSWPPRNCPAARPTSVSSTCRRAKG
jgi:transcriptional regulator of acetoin/glycerol metabolism